MAENKDEQRIKSPLSESEEKTLSFWKEQDIFQKTLEKPSPKGEFVFYEGPPTANGRPGIHHIEARSFKDIIPRYKTMQGFHVRRKAGWDTHGLPVELEVEKKLGFTSKKDIERYGIEKFNEECKKSVWTYVDEWRQFTDRIGYWVDMDHPYVTYDPKYMEAIWNIVGHVHKQGLLFKDYKVVPWCPRCGTALASHELAQGYQNDKDLAVYPKFKVVGKEELYILAWTTTPWTLPGNVALAVGKDIAYAEIVIPAESSTAHYILAKDRLPNVLYEYNIVREMKGSDLIGLEYEPLYPYLGTVVKEKQPEQFAKAFKVYDADFVTTEDGMGVVHTAVMYGQEDFELGTKLGLPKYHLVDETGHFTKDAGEFAGRFVKDEEVAIDIIKDLAHRRLLFRKESYEHSYPHCWRCKTPLIYYARDSWYIRMSALRDKLIAENESINWEPEYIREGRFGEWLREVKDWAISRERYWGTPLPIWMSEDKEEILVIDSAEALRKHTKSRRNTFLFVRHTEAESNANGIVNTNQSNPIHLTEVGKVQAKELGTKLAQRKVGAVYTSPFLRTKETTDIICETIGLSPQLVVEDNRIREYNFGDFDGKSFAEYLEYEEKHMLTYDTPIIGGESYLDAKKRFGEFLYDIDQKHENETILVVTHGIGLEVVAAIAEGADMKRSQEIINTFSPENGFVLEVPFVPLPHNHNFELDLHKPFIDDVVLISEKGTELRRVKEVMDVWFDSGAMPFAQDAGDKSTPSLFPADFISEAIDQTRGWFYTLHAIGVLMGKGKVYKNVICLGHILDKEGKKMSKSIGNVVNPWEMIDLYGVDPLRFWMYSVNQPGESKNFDQKTVDEVVKKVFNLASNVAKFYELYADARTETGVPQSSNVLDVWVLATLRQTISQMTEYLDNYKILEAARLVREFIADLSQWYLRRSRDRFKGEDEVDKKAAVETLGFVLETLAKMMAPFTPFFAEELYAAAKPQNRLESVHLCDWTDMGGVTAEDILSLGVMSEVRRLVTSGLEARTKANIKVRQPLSLITLKSENLKVHPDYLEVLMDEVNVKDVAFNPTQEEEVVLDTHINEDLQREGDARELMRAIQDLRKEKGLSPEDSITLHLSLTSAGLLVLQSFEEEVKKTCGIHKIVVSEMAEGESWFTIAI